MKRFTFGLAVLMTCGFALGACKLGSNDETEPAPTPPPPPAPTTAEEPPAPAANEVVRYSDAEAADQGTLTVRNGVRARRAADFTSEIIGTLMPGSEVDRVAKYGGFTLVSWATDQGNFQGWIDGNSATRTIALVPTTTTTTTTPFKPIVAVRPAATPKPVAPSTPTQTLTPPKPTTTALKPPSLGTPKPPTTTPKPPATTPKPPTTTTKPGVFKPPKLGK